jgi:hypothetical protein
LRGRHDAENPNMDAQPEQRKKIRLSSTIGNPIVVYYDCKAKS